MQLSLPFDTVFWRALYMDKNVPSRVDNNRKVSVCDKMGPSSTVLSTIYRGCTDEERWGGPHKVVEYFYCWASSVK